jgi:AcrR family transcriptional regulator
LVLARLIPSSRLDQLVDVATDVFISQGYRRTQMADVATAMGLAKGTLYGYVESKQALFGFALEHCDRRAPIPAPERLPLPTPAAGELAALFDARIAREAAMPTLGKAIATTEPADPRAELDAIVRELFGVLGRNHRGIRLLEACALDHPDLAARWNRVGRAGYRTLLTGLLERRSHEGLVRLPAEAETIARFVIETTTTWAVHIHFDPFPQNIANEVAEDMVVHFLTAGLLAPGRISA